MTTNQLPLDVPADKFCDKTWLSLSGSRYGCGLEPGHDGDCGFSRLLAHPPEPMRLAKREGNGR